MKLPHKKPSIPQPVEGKYGVKNTSKQDELNDEREELLLPLKKVLYTTTWLLGLGIWFLFVTLGTYFVIFESDGMPEIAIAVMVLMIVSGYLGIQYFSISMRYLARRLGIEGKG